MKTLQLPPDPGDLAKNRIRKTGTELKKAPVQLTDKQSKPVLDNFLKRFFPMMLPKI